jgi:Protein of unknown function (DUF4236)
MELGQAESGSLLLPVPASFERRGQVRGYCVDTIMALMGFRFHKRIRILKGLYVNLGSKKGPPVSVGGHGVTTNISGRGVHETFSLPGTGISMEIPSPVST